MKKLLSILLLSYCIGVFPQDKTEARELAEFAIKINTFNHLYPQEKVYLHFDNTEYYIGEKIWFKAYVVTATTLTYSDFSKVLYVELLTPEGKIAETKKLKIENGQARGCFVLQDLYFTGFYQVRAYTRCMLNFGEHVIFSRVFPIYEQQPEVENNIFDESNVKLFDLKAVGMSNLRKKEKANDFNLTFFPEGGDLITGVENQVAFKATDKEGKALNIEGKIYNSMGKEITVFSTQHLGMGIFILFPDGNKYTAKINYDNKEYTFVLPESFQSGYVMRVENLHPQTISIEVEKTADIPVQMLGITFACRGKVYAFKAFEMDSIKQYTLRLPKEDLPSGVVQITLFTSQGKVLAQRQAFINNNVQSIPVKITNIQANLSLFSPISIDFEINDSNNRPVETTFSLSVKEDEIQTGTSYTDNILFNLLLSSDLKGYIENPAYYFETDDNQRRMALDLLMRVQGWIRYPWKQAAGVETFEVKHGIEKCLMIEGSVLSSGKAKPQEDIEVSMWMTSKDGLSLQDNLSLQGILSLQGNLSLQGKCMTDKDGKFNFGLIDITGTFNLGLNAKKKDKRGKYRFYNSRITLDRNFSPEPLELDYYEMNMVAPMRTEEKEISVPDKPVQANSQILDNNFSTMQPGNNSPEDVAMSFVLPEVIIVGEMSSHRAMQKNTIAFYDVAREVDKYRDMGKTEPGNFLDFLSNIDPNFLWRKVPISKGRYKIETKYNGYDAPIFADMERIGVNTKSNYLEELYIDDVAYISIVQTEKGFPISVITNNAYDKFRRRGNGSRETYYDGFAPSIEFYSPDYSIAALPDEKDYRRTLYWNPDVRTDSLGRASVNFYNNGTCRKLSISAEGLTDNGVAVMYKEYIE